jgi:hypothetical protein
MRSNEHQLLEHLASAFLSLRSRLWDPLHADPAFEKLCEEMQP